MIRNIIICLLTLYIIPGNVSYAETSQSIVFAREQMDFFREQASKGSPEVAGYQALYKAALTYSDIVEKSDFNSPDFKECRQALIEIFPRLADGAYFYAARNDQEKVLDFACAYVDVSLLKCMESQHIQHSKQYSTLSNLAATNLYNRRQYDRSIKYFSAYLESGDPTAQENAFEGLARCYFESKQYGYAANICLQGSQRYPDNMNILLIGIESCGHNGNDAEMEPMLQKALSLQPNHKGLLEYQGKMYERMNRYEDAARSYSVLTSLQPSNLDYICHLGFNYYNAATLAFTRAKDNGSSSTYASGLFTKAAPHLRTVLDNSPYAANVARALALCYSLTNDAVRLKEVNNALSSMHYAPVDLSALPTLVQNYNPSPDPAPMALSATSAIAKGEELLSDVDIDIPSTGLNRPDTYVIIIANENYKNTEVQKVPFAHRDGKIFKEYCHNVLGVSKEKVKLLLDATSSEMRSIFRDLKTRTDMDPDKLNLIVYYAGHGNPDIPNNKSYLVPTDVRANNFQECLALDNLYSQLDEMRAKSVTVFLDACFSGASRSGQMMMSGRYVRKSQADIKPAGKTIVFSASSGEEAANAYNEQKHGYFTYFLLKALKETQGNITYAELKERLERDVKLRAFDVEAKIQTPSFQCPDALIPTIGDRRLID